jgi:AcrR family transcriptional regulator
MNERSFINGDDMSEDVITKGGQTRQAIIKAAHALFIEQGYHATSMRQIARRAGLVVGGLYNHFGSKEEIYCQVLLEYHPYRQIIPILQSSAGDTLEELVMNASLLFDAELGKRPDFMKLIFIELSEFKGAHASQLFSTIFPQVAPLLRRFQDRQGELREVPGPVVLLSFMGTFFAYFLSHYFLAASEFPELQENSIEHFMDVYLHGIIR